MELMAPANGHKSWNDLLRLAVSQSSGYNPNPFEHSLDIHIYREYVQTKTVHENAEGGFWPDSGQAHQILEKRTWVHLSQASASIIPKISNQGARGLDNLLCALSSKSRNSNLLENLVGVSIGHPIQGRKTRKEGFVSF
jgi:hypothetical protein